MRLSKKTVLIFTDWYFPGYKAGGPIQSCRNLVKMLTSEMDFYVATSDTDLNESRPYANIPNGKWVDGPEGEMIYYAKNARISATAIRRAIKEFKPDVVYFNSMFSPKFTIFPLITLKLMRFSGKLVLAPRGMLHKGALFFKTSKKRLFLRLFRFLNWHKQIHFHATDEQERKDIEANFPGSEVFVAENIPTIGITCQEHSHKRASNLKLIFFSRLHPKKNLEYILRLFNNSTFNGEIQLDVFGDAASQAYLDSCMQVASGLPANIKVRFMGGAAQEKIMKVISDYDAFILPTLGENFGHVIFESLMAGVPVLISDRTPWRKLSQEKSGWDIPLDQPETFTEKIKELMAMDSDEHQQWRKGARSCAEHFIQNAGFKQKYLELFR